MGDRTAVELTVLTKHAEAVEAVDDMGGETHSVNDDTTSYLYYDINYGDLNGYVPMNELGMLDKLREANIPYDVEWEAGCEFPRGGDYFRVMPSGTPSLTEVPCIDNQGTIHVSDLRRAIFKDNGDELDEAEALERIISLIEGTEVRDNPPCTLVENGEYIA
jgi:hypothetical protein